MKQTHEILRTGEAEDGQGDAACILLPCGGHLRHGRHRISRARASKIRLFQGQSEAGERLRRRPTRVRGRSCPRHRYVLK